MGWICQSNGSTKVRQRGNEFAAMNWKASWLRLSGLVLLKTRFDGFRLVFFRLVSGRNLVTDARYALPVGWSFHCGTIHS